MTYRELAAWCLDRSGSPRFAGFCVLRDTAALGLTVADLTPEIARALTASTDLRFTGDVDGDDLRAFDDALCEVTLGLPATTATPAGPHDAGAEAAAPVAVGQMAVECAHPGDRTDQDRQASERADCLAGGRIAERRRSTAVDVDRLDELGGEHEIQAITADPRDPRQSAGSAEFAVEWGDSSPSGENTASRGSDRDDRKP